MSLSDEMMMIADRDKLPMNHPLRIKATELNGVLEGNSSMKSILGAWARARKTYCEYTETPLVDLASIETGARLMCFLSGNKAVK